MRKQFMKYKKQSDRLLKQLPHLERKKQLELRRKIALDMQAIQA
jgi:hypothetical protein